MLCIFALDFVQLLKYNKDNGKGGVFMPMKFKIDVLAALKEKGTLGQGCSVGHGTEDSSGKIAAGSQSLQLGPGTGILRL